jgi:hypothetical protein
MPGRAQVDDAQAAVTENDPSVRAMPKPGIVRTAVRNAIAHFFHMGDLARKRVGTHWCRTELELPRNATHLPLP